MSRIGWQESGGLRPAVWRITEHNGTHVMLNHLPSDSFRVFRQYRVSALDAWDPPWQRHVLYVHVLHVLHGCASQGKNRHDEWLWCKLCSLRPSLRVFMWWYWLLVIVQPTTKGQLQWGLGCKLTEDQAQHINPSSWPNHHVKGIQGVHWSLASTICHCVN